MNRSSDGPARSLLNSFTVATTPPPRATTDVSRAEAQGDAQRPLESSAHVNRGVFSSFTRADAGKPGEEEEDPSPSFIAPQPAPAPNSSTDTSAIRSASTAPPGLLSTGWASTWKPTAMYTPRTRSGGDVASASTPGGAQGTPFTWRSSRAEAQPRTPAWKTQRLYTSSDALGDGEPPLDVGRLTPKIRYRGSSSSADRRSPEQQTKGVQGLTADAEAAPHARRRSSSSGSATVNRVTLAGPLEEQSRVSTWLPLREHVTPTIAPVAAWQPASILKPTAEASASAAAGQRDGAGRTSSLRPPPPLLQLRTRPSAVSETAVSPTAASTAAETRSDAASIAFSTAPMTSWHLPVAAAAGSAMSGRQTSARSTSRVSVKEVWAESQEQPSQPHQQRPPRPQPNDVSASGNEEGYTAGVSDAEDGTGESELFYVGKSLNEGDATLAAAGPVTLAHLTLRSLTEEYNHFSSEGTVGWVGLQVHLRRHTQSTQITSLDLTCYRMQREQWSWFTLEILPQLKCLQVLRLVQMQLGDDEVAELVRGSCGLSSHGDSARAASASRRAPLSSPTHTSTPSLPHGVSNGAAHPHSSSSTATSASSSTARVAPLQFLRVLDLSGNAFTQRSCNHLGKMMLWMADSLEEVRLLGNPLKDYGMQTLAIYVAKLNVESLQQDPELFPGTLRHQLRLITEGRHVQPGARPAGNGGAEREKTSSTTLENLPIGPVLLDLRDCRASARGLSDMLAAASRAHRLRVVALSHNVAGVTALLPLPTTAYQEALDVASEAAQRGDDSRTTHARSLRRGPAPRRLRLVKTPLTSSGALLRRQQTAFSEVAGFATSCALTTLVFHSVPLSQTCSPVGCRELLLNIFFSCPQLDQLDLSDTFEWTLVPQEEQQQLVEEANRRDTIEQRLRGPEVQRGLQMYREDQGEVEFALDSATVAGQTRMGDIFGELMAHAAYNAVMRRRVVPAAFAHVRELHLSNTGLTDAGVRGLCVSVRRGRSQTGMLACLTVLNLSDNLLTERGCARVISSFLLEESSAVGGDTQDNDGSEGESAATRPQRLHASQRPSVAIVHMTVLALQRNAGVSTADGDDDAAGDADRIAGYLTDGTVDGDVGGSQQQQQRARQRHAYLGEVCTAAEAAVLRRASLRSAAHGSSDDGAPALTVYFSAPPAPPQQQQQHQTITNGEDGSADGRSREGHYSSGRRRRSPTADSSVTVYYAGCDERGDIFCTCPRSRFYVPKTEAERFTAASEAPTTSRSGSAPAGRSASQAAPASSASGRGVANDLAALPQQSTAVFAPAGTPPPAAQRRLLSALDVPPTPTQLLRRGQLQGLRGGAPDVRLPPRAAATTTSIDSATGLVNSAPPHVYMSGAGDPLLSSLSFPPPPSASPQATAVTAGGKRTPTPHDAPLQPSQQLALQAPPSSRHASLVSTTGASLGSLFMDKTEPREAVEGEGSAQKTTTSPTAADAAARNDVLDSTQAEPQKTGDVDGADGDERDNLNSSTARSGRRRAKARATRTFTLSYDHPAGHLLCRALGVLLRPASDHVGEGARAALAQDLLAALQRACARASAYPDGDDSAELNRSTDDGSGGSPRAAVTVEAVRYIPADLSSPDAAAESHWMRFEITTNERKARMAQRLQEVLNVSFAAQCVRFTHLLQWLRAHVAVGEDISCAVTGEEEEAKAKAKRAKVPSVVAEWDPVQVIDRAARVSPAVRAQLDALYGGSAVTAVHAHHMDEGDDNTALVNGDASPAVTLAQLHPTLWMELGLTAAPARKEEEEKERERKEEIDAPAAASAVASAKETVVSPPMSTLTYRQARDSATTTTTKEADVEKAELSEAQAEEKEAADDMYSAISKSEDPSRHSDNEKEEKAEEQEIVGDALSAPESASEDHQPAARPPVVDLYADVNVSTDALQVTQRPAAAAVESDQLSNDPILISTSLSPASPPFTKPATTADSHSTAAPGQASRVIRRFTAISHSGSDNDADDEEEEKNTPSVATPEKQTRRHDAHARPEPQSFTPPPPTPSLEEEQQQQARSRQTEQNVEDKAHVSSAGDVAAQAEAEGLVLTDQLMGPSSPTDGVVSRQKSSAAEAAAAAASPAVEDTALVFGEAVEEKGPVDVPAAVASRSQRSRPDLASTTSERKMREEREGRSWSGSSPESRGRDGTRSDSPSSPPSRQRVASLKDAPPSLRPAGAEKEDVNATLSSKEGKEENESKGEEEEEFDISSPVRIHRHPSDLEGRVKTFTLSYTHQEGTAVCRAWRLLHAAMNAEDATETRSPTSPSKTALAQEARDCLCDDFLSLLQPPDDDTKHAVLSVTLHGDVGAATAMLQVQVQTNERRATLANRLQDSNHGVRRGVGAGGGRSGLVPLTVAQVDRFYFPRLTRLLRRHKTAADTVAQLESYLATRPTVQSRLLKSYGGVGSLVHYYHGSATALEHELGITSWSELTSTTANAASASAGGGGGAGAPSVFAPAEAAQMSTTPRTRPPSSPPADVTSPTVADDRVVLRSDTRGDTKDKREEGVKPKEGDRVAEESNDHGAAAPARSHSPSEGKRPGGGGLALRAPPAMAGPLQGRPPPHPRRPPTPPNPITHSSSISIDEITEEPTSEAGPIVVLRGSTPSVTAGRSPSTPNTRNPQYFPAGFRGDTAGEPPPPSPRAMRPGEHGRQADAYSDPNALSPLTSASASPSMARLASVSPPPPGRLQLSLEGSRSGQDNAAEQSRAAATTTSLSPTSPVPQTPQRTFHGSRSGAPQPPPRLNPEQERAAQQDRRAAPPNGAATPSMSRQVSNSLSSVGGKSEYERVLEGKYKRLMRVAYDGVARGSVPLDPQHQQKTVIGRGKWGTQKVELSLEWEILFVLTFEKSRTLGRSSRRAQMIVHPVGCGFECMSGDEAPHPASGGAGATGAGNDTSSLHSSMVNAIPTEGSFVHHPPGATASQASKGSRSKRDSAKSAASHLIITIQRPFSPNEVGSSSSEMEKTLMAGALLTVSSPTSLSKAARLLTGGGGGSSSNGGGGGDDASNTSRGSAGTHQAAQEIVYQLCQRNLTLDIEMKNAKHVQEALRFLKNSIRRATQAVKKSMQNAHIPPSQ